jgi:HNH endonuclease
VPRQAGSRLSSQTLAIIHKHLCTMKVPWKGTQCIVCLDPAAFTEEHIIPAALGGRLTCRFLCITCNSKLGRSVEGHAKSDPTIQFLAKKLAGRVPKLASQLLEGQTYVSSGPGGASRGRVIGGEFVVRSEKLSDDSLIQPTPIAAKSIRRMLERDSHDQASVEKALALFELAPENTRVALSETIEVVKWSIESVRPALDGPLLNLSAPLKTAYEFLALHLKLQSMRTCRPSQLRAKP